jgi:hypothetical protein
MLVFINKARGGRKLHLKAALGCGTDEFCLCLREIYIWGFENWGWFVVKNNSLMYSQLSLVLGKIFIENRE